MILAFDDSITRVLYDNKNSRGNDDCSSIYYEETAAIEYYWKTVVYYESQENDELLEQLASKTRWSPRYSSKKNIKLSDKDKMIGALDRAKMISGELPHSSNTISQFT